MPKKDYYETLGVEKSATIDDIKKAYRKQALKHHPDRNKGDKISEDKFKEINEAYQVLSDPEKKKQYDTFGSYQDTPGGGAGFSGFEGFDFSGFSGNQQGGFGGFEDIFETFFGGGFGGSRQNRSRQSSRGEDLKTSLTVTFEEAAFGVEKEVMLNRKEICNTCSGSGAEPGSKTITCSNCSGTGQVSFIQRSFLGNIRSVSVCDVCGGKGNVPETKCHTCRGQGRTDVNERIVIKVPTGIEDGVTIRLKGKGNAGKKDETPGDLYVLIRVEPSKKFTREGSDIQSGVEISNVQAVLGDTISIDTLYGKKEVKIPKGIQDNEVIRLKELGVQKIGGYSKGDHYLTINIRIPKKLSKKEEELYKELLSLQKPEKKNGWFS